MCTPSHQRGFSIPELIVYIGILGITTLLVVNVSVTLARSYAGVRSSLSISRSASLALERITREIRDAQMVSAGASVFTTSPGTLTLLSTATTTVFSLTDGAITLTVNGVSQGVLTHPSTVVESLIFLPVTTTRSSGVRVVVVLSAGEGERRREATFTTGALMRGSYQSQ